MDAPTSRIVQIRSIGADPWLEFFVPRPIATLPYGRVPSVLEGLRESEVQLPLGQRVDPGRADLLRDDERGRVQHSQLRDLKGCSGTKVDGRTSV